MSHWLPICYRLAKVIGEQFRDKLKQSHDNFTQAMKRLELHHSGRLEKAGDRQQKLRKIHAPKVAKLAMESASLRDLIMYGESCIYNKKMLFEFGFMMVIL